MAIRLDYNEKMMQLKEQYNTSNEELYEIENQSNIDEVTDNILNSTISKVEERADESLAETSSIQTF